MNQTYRTPAKQAEAEPVKTKSPDWALRIFIIFILPMIAAIVVILVRDVGQGRRCERYGVCELGKPTWVEGKCVCIATAHMKE